MNAPLSPADAAKRRAATRALDFVRPGMRLGLGTGSTARHFVDLLGEKVRAGLEVVGVPTSAATAAQAAAAGIALTNLDDTPNLDLTVDGADEFDGARRLIKGGGGALLREKIVAAASAGMVVIVDSSKEVERLGRFRLPVEVDRFGLRSTEGKVRDACVAAGLSGAPVLRTGVDKTAFVTDGGHLILDCPSGAISNPEALATALDAIPGVLGHGLFLGLATAIIIADGESVRVVGASAL